MNVSAMSEAYNALIASTDGAMIVVTASDGAERAGCVVGFHSQCGIDPPRHAVWLSKANHTYRVALHATHLAVHFLTAADEPIARIFGGRTGDKVDKFAGVEWSEGPGGTPLLSALPHQFVVGDDHACFVLSVDEATCPKGFQPLQLGALGDLSPGHPAEDRPVPTEVRTPSE